MLFIVHVQYMCKGSHEAVVSLLNVASLPVTFPQGIPRFDQCGIVFHSSRETILCLLAVLGRYVEGSPL